MLYELVSNAYRDLELSNGKQNVELQDTFVSITAPKYQFRMIVGKTVVVCIKCKHLKSVPIIKI